MQQHMWMWLIKEEKNMKEKRRITHVKQSRLESQRTYIENQKKEREDWRNWDNFEKDYYKRCERKDEEGGHCIIYLWDIHQLMVPSKFQLLKK